MGDVPTRIHVPTARDEQRSWIWVVVVATLGFAAGVAWPRLLEMRLGPTAPGSAPPVAPAPVAAPARSAASVAPVGSASSAVVPAAVAMSISKPYTLSCRTQEGETRRKASDCGALGDVGAALESRLRKVATCPAASGVKGKLSLVLTAEFASSKVTIELGKATAIAKADELLACARDAMTGVSLTGIEHDNPRYSILYHLTFTSVGEATENSARSKSGDSVLITFGKAIVRDGPKASSNRLDSLTRGTEVKIIDQQGGWYKVRYGDAFTNEGWVYRQAIGK